MTTRTPTERDTVPPEDRWQTIKAIWRDNQWLFAVVGFLVGLLAFPLIQTLDTDAGGFLQNLVPESIGIAFTVFIIDRLNARRAEKEKIEELVRQVRSGSNDFARFAINELRHRGLLEREKSVLQGKDMSWSELREVDLRDTNLSKANLHHANLSSANIQNIDLSGAILLLTNLRKANLDNSDLSDIRAWFVDFTEANLNSTNLSRAKMNFASLSRAGLSHANLNGAELRDANLNRARLVGASLCGADLQNAELEMALFSILEPDGTVSSAQLDERTILPDGTHYDPILGLEQLLRFGCIVDLELSPSVDAEEGK